jgi:hypothetical protein
LTGEVDRFVLEREEQRCEARLVALRVAIDEGDASGTVEGDVFARVREAVELHATFACGTASAGRKELEKDPEIVRQIWERAERCGDWGQFNGPDALMLYGPLAALMRASLQAAGRASSNDVRAILDRALHELEEL